MDALWSGWWSLKGPAAWCATIGADTADGRSVILATPFGLPPGARDALLHVCSGDGSSVVTIDDAGSRHPVTLLVDALGLSTQGESSSTMVWIPQRLMEHRRLIWVSGIAPEQWPTWAKLLPGWGDAVRSLPDYARPVLVVMLPPGCSPPPSDAALLIRQWQWNQVEPDIPAWERHVSDGGGMSVIQRVEYAQHVTVAGWDPAVIVALRATRDSASIVQALAGMARERGWNAQTPSTWASGVIPEPSAPISRAHPAWLVATNKVAEIERRIWSAQLSVVMPAIETRRLVWVSTYAQQMKLPWLTSYGTLTHPVDVEIGVLDYQVKKGIIRAGAETALIDSAAKMRNELAHGRLIPLATLEQFFVGKASTERQ